MIVGRGMPVDAMTHPLLRELLAMLPSTDTPFPRDRQRCWVEAAEAVLALVYGDDDDHADFGDDDDDRDDDLVGEAPTVEDHDVSGNGAATAWTTNGHAIAGRHRRIERFGLS
jgi:hypothetical protein